MFPKKIQKGCQGCSHTADSTEESGHAKIDKTPPATLRKHKTVSDSIICTAILFACHFVPCTFSTYTTQLYLCIFCVSLIYTDYWCILKVYSFLSWMYLILHLHLYIQVCRCYLLTANSRETHLIVLAVLSHRPASQLWTKPTLAPVYVK